MRATLLIVLYSLLSLFSVGVQAAPTRIEDLTCASTGPGRVECTWTTPAPSAGFALAVNDCRRSTVPITTLNWATRTQLAEPTPAAPGTAVNLAVTGLPASTLVYLACKTQDSSGSWSLISNTQSATTWAATRTLTLAWDPSPSLEVNNYRLYWGAATGNYTSWADAGNQTTYTVPGLSWSTPVFFAVKATAPGNESTFSNEVSAPAY